MANQFKRYQNQEESIQLDSQTTPQTWALFTVVPFGAFLLLLMGISFMSSLIGLAVVTPVYILFSPVIVPATIVIGLAVMGFMSSGVLGIMAVTVFSWIVNHLRLYRTGPAEDVRVIMPLSHGKPGIMARKVKPIALGREGGT